jgi:glycosyltransferase involved in cell wall biosynthesis
MTFEVGPPGGSDDVVVSVIVPTRQRPELLARALRSILAQRFDGALEVVVVFDQETPVHPDVEVGDGRSLRVLENDRSPGLAGARNTGVLAATGRFVAHCDDDDEWLPVKLAAQVRAMDASDSEVAATGTTIVYGDRMVDRIPATRAVTMPDLLRSRMQEIHPSSIMVRRDAMVEGIGLVDEQIPGGYGEDYEWFLRAARRRPILVVPDPLVRVHWHQSSFFSSRWPAIIDGIDYLLAHYPEFQKEPKGLARLLSRKAFAYAAMAQGSQARSWAWRALKLDPTQRRAYLALLVSTRIVSADTLMRLAHRTGRGI